jgi:putative nucleotidyltransferase with HDIG domain
MFLRFGETIALQVLISSIAAGTVTVILFKKMTQRATLMIAGLLSGLTVGAVYVIFALINYEGWMDMLLYAGMGLASGLVASVLAIGTLPMWESVFRMLTPMKLLEIANPNQPLLKQLLNEAPGTYHHSIMVGNMAERAAEVIGANSFIVRAGAYYHDIGKLKRPYFFVENQQGGKNPHDNIKPELSTQIITSHLTDGVDLVKKAKLPPVIVDMVREHHGNTAVMYFYHKTKKSAVNPDEVNIDDFRYDGNPPVSKESAILMLADSVEAAVRSIENPTAQNVREMIDKIIKSRLDDGQLGDCDLTMREIKAIGDSFMTALVGLYHERVEYPGEKDER